MSWEQERRHGRGDGGASDTGGGVAPGKRTLSSALPVQRRASPPAGNSDADAGVGAGGPAVESAAGGAGDDPFGLHLTNIAELGSGIERARDARSGDGSDLQPRLPTGADIKSMLAAKNVPEADLKKSIEMALTRMAKEGKLKTKDPVADIMTKIFPSAGKFDDVEFGKVVDTADRNKIYENVADAQTKLDAVDKPKLLAVMDDAAKLIDKAIGNAAGLKEVFGTEDAQAKKVYTAAKAAIIAIKPTVDTSIHTDYNRDDEEIGLGGYARFSTQTVHLTRKVAGVSDKNESTITVIHEFSHLADATVKDRGYYASPGFEAKSDADKVGNAAHYEELPRRELGTSKFAGHTFKPGVTKGGGAMTFEDNVREDASEFLRKAWDKAVDVHLFLRRIRADIDGGSKASFNANQARILELSKLMKLTIHAQTPPSTINMNDIVLAEGVAHATTIIKRAAKAQAVPAAPAMGKVQQDYVDDVVNGSIKSYGALTGSHPDDRAIFDWLVKEYKKAL